MDQMNVSMTDHLASYVRKKVKIGRYNNASEVVRDAARRMEEQEAREARLAQPAAELMLADLAGEQRESIPRLVGKRWKRPRLVISSSMRGAKGCGGSRTE